MSGGRVGRVGAGRNSGSRTEGVSSKRCGVLAVGPAAALFVYRVFVRHMRLGYETVKQARPTHWTQTIRLAALTRHAARGTRHSAHTRHTTPLSP